MCVRWDSSCRPDLINNFPCLLNFFGRWKIANAPKNRCFCAWCATLLNNPGGAHWGAPRGLEGPQGPQEIPQRGPGGVTADFMWASAGHWGPNCSRARRAQGSESPKRPMRAKAAHDWLLKRWGWAAGRPTKPKREPQRFAQLARMATGSENVY